MLITLHIADYSIANHYTDPQAIYVSDLTVKTLSFKKGLALDTIRVSLHRELFDAINRTLTYICFNTRASLYIDQVCMLQGYISKLELTPDGMLNFDVTSAANWMFAQNPTPNVSQKCQLDIYSPYCKLRPEEWSIHFTQVSLDLFTGFIPLDIDTVNNQISFGGSAPVTPGTTFDGNVSLYDGNNNLIVATSASNSSAFLTRSNWNSAIVVLNQHYKAFITMVTSEGVYIGINYTPGNIVIDTVSIYMKCDKTYGDCYRRFNNTSNFLGFANAGSQIATIDIFSASNLSYCGDDQADTTFESCPSDFNLFGVELDG